MKKNCFLLFVVLFVLSAAGQSLDYRILVNVNVDRNTSLDNSFKFVSNSSQYLTVGVPLGLLGAGLLSHNKILIRQGENAVVSFAISSIATYALKTAIHRNRPFVDHPDIVKLSDGGGYSFPSGHTSAAFCLATSIAMDNKQWYIRVPVFTWAALVGYSRMHLGVHYPTDVLGGALVGAGSAIAGRKITAWLNKDKKHKQEEKQQHTATVFAML